MPDDKWIALPVASLRRAIGAGQSRDTRKAEARWVPSRWQLADCLTKKGLSVGFREAMKKGYTRLHELSLQHVRRNRAAKSAAKSASYEADTHWTWLCYDKDTTTQLPQPVANHSLGCSWLESHISGGLPVVEKNLCSKPTRSGSSGGRGKFA